MADDDWKKRIGIPINYSSDSSEDEGESKCNTDERYGGLENIPASPFDSLENNIQLDEILNKYAEYGNTPPRTRISRRQRERKWKDENSGDGKASPKVVQSHSRIRRRNTIDNFPHLQVFSEFNDSEQTNQTENEQFRADSHKRKRSLKLLRESERDFKLDLATVSNNISSTMEHTEDRAESLPVIVQQPALKVETCNRFMSLTSKLVPCKEERSETPTPQKVAQLQGCPQSRLEFYKTFSLLIRMGNPDKQDKNYSRQLSKEEHLWQSELKDLIWLELQAWHADRSPTEQDQYLCNSRKEVGNLLNEITRYKFENKGCSISDSCDTVIEDKQLETDSAVFCDKNDSSSNVRSDEVKDDSISCENSTSAQTKDTYAKVVSVPDYAAKFKKGGCFCNGCLSMYCRSCSISQNAALRQIEDLLTRLEAAEALYPSSKAFANDYPLYKSPELVGRVKAMCLWYNMTNHHRLKVSILGKLLLKSNQWPKMDDDQGSSSGVTDTSTSDDVSYEEVMSSIRHRGVDPNLDGKLFTKDNKHRVQFDFNELEAEAESVSSDSQFSSNPSDSNNSNDSRSTISSEANIRSRNMSLVDLSQDMCVKSSPTSPYRKYIEDVLKTRGLRKALQFLEHLHRIVLRRSRITLEKPVSSEDVALNVESDVPILEQTDVCNHLPNSTKNNTTMTEEEEELRRYGYWSPEAQALGLPSYRGAYLFLCRIPIDVIHEYLRMRLEQKPEEPSALSIRQLMREFKEGLRIAVVHRQRYLHLIRAALWDVKPEMLDRFEQVISDFDRSVKTVMEVYLEYLQQWVLMIQQESFLITTYQKNLLEEEWNFVRATCPHIPGGEALAGNSFCRMASGMLGAIADHLNTGIDELTVHVDDSTLSDEESSTKQVMLSVCREFHSIFNEARERALKAVAFAKTLRKDLEIAASYTLNVPPVAFMKKLKETGHVRVIAPHSCSHLIFIPGNIKSYSDHIRKLLNMSCDASASEAESGYLLLTRCEDCVNIPGFWDGETISIQPTAETTITLSNVEVQGLLLVVCDPAQLSVHRRSFQKMMGDIVTLGQENCPSNYIIAESLEELKREALDLRNHITATIQKVEEKCDVREMLELDEAERASLQSRCREILHQCYKFGFEYHKEVSRLVTGDARTKLAEGLISFAKQWMYFVKERCERGRGLRPRWANQGLNFLITVLEPQNTMYLSNEEFEKLKASIDECVSHVIGTADKGHPFRNVSECRSRGTSPSPLNRKPYRSSRSVQESSDKRQHEIPRSLSSQLPRGDVSPGSPDITDSPLVRRKNQQLFPSSSLSEEKFDGCVVETIPVPSKKLSRVQRVQRAIVSLESKIEDRLHDEDLIGTVTSVRTEDKVHIRARSVTFSWQRGIKIGQGRFGKVYTAVNNQTGELMAMKEIQLQPNDHRTIRNVAEELRIFEGIHHRHLVRYYGVEIHREEMLIFMEYCAEGTLENLVAATQNGLPEELIRRFTRQLLEAVSTLHEHGIVHRDIKSANIFLTDEGNCLKLGDFGSAVKIKAHTTLPGELQGFVGTQAYMAPEVFMKTEGHGRAADIWSVGCVVVEMASGKRPWHEYDSNYQIMFKVGMGEIPTIPTTLLEEGQQFLEQCLQHDPRKRAAAADLLEHTFVKVEVDEEYLSLPLPSISEDYTRSNARK